MQPALPGTPCAGHSGAPDDEMPPFYQNVELKINKKMNEIGLAILKSGAVTHVV